MSFVWVSLAALVFAFVGSLPLAGPIALLVVSNGVSGRHKEALRIALGAALAEGIYAFLAFWGFATFLTRYRLVLPISHGVTAAILLALGVRFVFFKVKEEKAQSREMRPGRFWVGFSISFISQYRGPSSKAVAAPFSAAMACASSADHNSAGQSLRPKLL